MSENIYQQGIKVLAAAEHGAGHVENADATVTQDNPLCGDRVTLELKLQNGRITALSHNVRGCLLCRAAASAIGEVAVGLLVADVEAVQMEVAAMLKGEALPDWPVRWQSLSLFKPVQAHKSRHNCVLLPFKALIAACSQRH